MTNIGLWLYYSRLPYDCSSYPHILHISLCFSCSFEELDLIVMHDAQHSRKKHPVGNPQCLEWLLCLQKLTPPFLHCGWKILKEMNAVPRFPDFTHASCLFHDELFVRVVVETNVYDPRSRGVRWHLSILMSILTVCSSLASSCDTVSPVSEILCSASSTLLSTAFTFSHTELTDLAIWSCFVSRLELSLANTPYILSGPLDAVPGWVFRDLGCKPCLFSGVFAHSSRNDITSLDVLFCCVNSEVFKVVFLPGAWLWRFYSLHIMWPTLLYCWFLKH